MRRGLALLAVLALAQMQRLDLVAAERAILAALEIEPDNAVWLARYSQILQRSNQLDKAEQVLDAAAAADPEEPDVLEERISLAYLRGDNRGMRKASRELLALDPGNRVGLARSRCERLVQRPAGRELHRQRCHLGARLL